MQFQRGSLGLINCVYFIINQKYLANNLIVYKAHIHLLCCPMLLQSDVSRSAINKRQCVHNKCLRIILNTPHYTKIASMR